MDYNLDFLALTETWLSSPTPTTIIDVPGYTCFRKDRLSGKGDGVFIYMDIFKCTLVNVDTNGLECLILNVILSPKMNFNITVLYNPPKHNLAFYQRFDDLLKALNFRSEILYVEILI